MTATAVLKSHDLLRLGCVLKQRGSGEIVKWLILSREVQGSSVRTVKRRGKKKEKPGTDDEDDK